MPSHILPPSSLSPLSLPPLKEATRAHKKGGIFTQTEQSSLSLSLSHSMAVDAHHRHLFPSHFLRSRDVMNTLENQGGVFDMQTGSSAAPLVSVTAAATAPFLPLYNPFAPTTVAATGTVAASECFQNINNGNGLAATASRKRPPQAAVAAAASVLSHELSSQVQQQMLDVDLLILQHAEKVRMELMERRRRFTRQILAAVEEGFGKRLKAKEEEIDRIGKLNWALEERIKSLCVENQIWRDLAQSSENTANVLRSNLEQVLVSQLKVKVEQEAEQQNYAAAAATSDVESCCCGDNRNGEDDNYEFNAAAAVVEDKGYGRRVCRNCRRREPSVLLLPCRHLCLCAACSPVIDACPICNCGKDGSVNVNMS